MIDFKTAALQLLERAIEIQQRHLELGKSKIGDYERGYLEGVQEAVEIMAEAIE
jgi:hypothetical protein